MHCTAYAFLFKIMSIEYRQPQFTIYHGIFKCMLLETRSLKNLHTLSNDSVKHSYWGHMKLEHALCSLPKSGHE